MYHHVSELGNILFRAMTQILGTMALLYWLIALPLLIAIAWGLARLFTSQHGPRPRYRSVQYVAGLKRRRHGSSDRLTVVREIRTSKPTSWPGSWHTRPARQSLKRSNRPSMNA